MFKMNKLFKKINYEKKHQKNKNLNRNLSEFSKKILKTLFPFKRGIFFIEIPSEKHKNSFVLSRIFKMVDFGKSSVDKRWVNCPFELI